MIWETRPRRASVKMIYGGSSRLTLASSEESCRVSHQYKKFAKGDAKHREHGGAQGKVLGGTEPDNLFGRYFEPASNH